MIFDKWSWARAGVAALGLVGMALASGPGPDEPPPRPRPGLTAQQTNEAVKLAQGAMVELRRKTEGASSPGVDLREFVIGVELLSGAEPTPRITKDPDAPAAGETSQPSTQDKEKNSGKTKEPATATGPRAVVTSYRYFDDITVFSTVDLRTNRVVKVEAAQHLRTPLSQSEFELAKELAREKSDEVKQLHEHFGDQLSVYPQFSQFSVKDDPRVHRVVHLTYRVGKRDLSYPRPRVDLTLREVETPAPDGPEPARRPPPRSR